MPNVLLVDDDPAVRSSLARFVQRHGHTITQASDAAEGVEHIEREAPDLVVTDMEMPGGTGFMVLEAGMKAQIPVVILTAHASVEMAVEAMRRGAANFLTKPFSADTVAQMLQDALGAKSPVRDKPPVKLHRGSGNVEPVIGEDKAFREVLDIVERVADTDATILITGESGTGKEVVAHAIHNASKRRDKPFVAVNCGAIPEQLLESELFGHIKGAFTGATQARRGRFALADGGTLFLDEIGDMPMVLQVKLLRVIQERQYEVLGDSRSQPANVRFIAATHRDLDRLVSEGKFREDLFYRLNVMDMHLPPLRERTRDIPLLIGHFITEANAAHQRSVTGITMEARDLLSAHTWPGNIRELGNVIERMVVIRGSGMLDVRDVPVAIRTPRSVSSPGSMSSAASGSATAAASAGGAAVASSPPQGAAPMELPSSGIDLGEALQKFEGVLIEQALERTRGNRTQAAALLRINRTTLVEKLKRREGGGEGSDED